MNRFSSIGHRPSCLADAFSEGHTLIIISLRLSPSFSFCQLIFIHLLYYCKIFVADKKISQISCRASERLCVRKMSGFDLPTKAQLMESCNTVESVLDSLRDHTSISLTNRSRIISPVKALFTSLQRLEEDEAKIDGAFHTTDARARHNLAGVLTSCGVVAGQLRKRINSNALRHDDGLGIELMTLTAEIEEFMKLGKKKATARPKPGTASESSALVEDLLRKQQKHESEVEGLGMQMSLTRAGPVILTWRQRLSYIVSTPAKGPSSKKLLHSGLSSPPRTS
jgi:hypothetical protein